MGGNLQILGMGDYFSINVQFNNNNKRANIDITLLILIYFQKLEPFFPIHLLT